MKRVDLLRLDEVLRKLAVEMGPEVMQQHVASVEDIGRDNHIGIDGPEGDL